MSMVFILNIFCLIVKQIIQEKYIIITDLVLNLQCNQKSSKNEYLGGLNLLIEFVFIVGGGILWEQKNTH